MSKIFSTIILILSFYADSVFGQADLRAFYVPTNEYDEYYMDSREATEENLWIFEKGVFYSKTKNQEEVGRVIPAIHIVSKESKRKIIIQSNGFLVDSAFTEWGIDNGKLQLTIKNRSNNEEFSYQYQLKYISDLNIYSLNGLCIELNY